MPLPSASYINKRPCVTDRREAGLWLRLTYHTQEAPTSIPACPFATKEAINEADQQQSASNVM